MTEKFFLRLLDSKKKEIHKLVSNTWPRKVGVYAVNQFTENFRRGGFLDKSRVPWKITKRQQNPKHIKSGKVTAASSYGPLLSSRNHLMKSTYYECKDGETIIRNDVKYAKIHNEGGRAGRGRKVLIPKRQFIGRSQTLDKKIMTMITKDLEKLFKI